MKTITFQESYSSRMLKELSPGFWIRISIFAFAVLVLALCLIVPSFRRFELYALLFEVIIFLSVRKSTDRIVDDIRNFGFGKQGEEYVLDILKKTLDDDYVYVQNYVIPNTRIGDIDGLLIGPKGILIIEIKNWTGTFRISGGDMYRRLKYDVYKLYRKSPFWQTLRQKEYLQKFLKEKGSEVKVGACVALVGSRISSISGETKVYITEAPKLTNHIFEMPSMPGWSGEMQTKIIAALGIHS